jgi:uncharacterized membrane protein HdeD (DUF308 family)
MTTSYSPRTSYDPTVPPSEAMNAVLARYWWAVALRGLLAVLFGLICFFVPAATMLSLVLLFSAYTLVSGAFAIVGAARAARRHESWGVLAFEGIANIAAGILAFLLPGLTVVAFVLLIAAWSIVSGVLLTTLGLRLNADHGRWWLTLGGILSVAFGVLLIIAPLAGAVVLTWWLGAYALAFGILMLILGFKLRSRHTDRPHPTVAQRRA